MKTLILGIGNILLGDEGIGVHTITALEDKTLPKNVDILDGGTGGFHLMSYFREYPHIIMIDATMDERPPGTVSVLKPRFSKDFPKSLSAHDIGLKDMIDSVALLDKLPEIDLITVSIELLTEGLSLDLTPPVKDSIGEVIEKVYDLLSLKGKQ
ncbi:MAG: hydrogenase maturation protease [Ignavibacteriota bacterium]|nr:hydrogenase maturation protease [Ignavibacteriota bacterium]